MARLSTVVVLLVAAFSYAGATDTKEISSNRLSVVHKESLLAARAVRNIKINGPICKVELSSMASDFVVSLDAAAYELNTVIPNIAGKEHELLVECVQIMANTTKGIQAALRQDSEELKEKLALTLEKLSEKAAVDQIPTVNNKFALIQLKKYLDFVTYGIYKLKYRAFFFEKPNKELEGELRESVGALIESFNALSLTNKFMESEVRQSLIHAMVYTARNAYKLQNWIEVNSNSTEELNTVQEGLRIVSGLVVRELEGASKNHPTEYLKAQFIDIYTVGMNNTIDLAQVKYPNYLGGQEFIRSLIFDVTATARMYVDNTKRVLSLI